MDIDGRRSSGGLLVGTDSEREQRESMSEGTDPIGSDPDLSEIFEAISKNPLQNKSGFSSEPFFLDVDESSETGVSVNRKFDRPDINQFFRDLGRNLDVASVVGYQDFPYTEGGAASADPFVEREYWLKLSIPGLRGTDGYAILHVLYMGKFYDPNQCTFTGARSTITQINIRHTWNSTRDVSERYHMKCADLDKWREKKGNVVLGHKEAPHGWKWREDSQRKLTWFTSSLRDLLEKGETCKRVVRKKYVENMQGAAAVRSPDTFSRSKPPFEEGVRDAGWVGLRLAALCIGVGAYSGSSRLDNPVRDAEALFETINNCPDCRAAILRDPDSRSTILEYFKKFLKELADLPAEKLPEVVMLLLGGHGMQHDSNVFLIPTKAKCDDELDLEDKCLSHIRVLEYLRKVLDEPARGTVHKPKSVKFVLIMDVCRVPGEFTLTDKISEPDQKKAPGCWSICYSTSRGSVAADGKEGSHSPLVLGLLDRQSGIFAPGISLEQGIKNACKAVEELSGVDIRQRPINIALDALEGFILHPASDNRPSVNDAVTVSARERSQKVSEGAGSADTPTYQYKIVEYLKKKGLQRIAERLSEELSLEEIGDLQYVKEERLNKLEWLEDVPRAKLLKLVREVTARFLSAGDSDAASESSTLLAHSEGSPDDTAFVSDSEDVLIAARHGGDCADFQVHMTGLIRSFFECFRLEDADPEWETFDWGSSWTLCMLLWIRFAHDATLDQRLCEKWREVTSNSPNQDQLLSILTECLKSPGTTHPRLSPAESSECRKEHAAGIFFTDAMVEHALRGNENAKHKWRGNVVQDWFHTDEPSSVFLSRANKFLRDPEHSIKGMSIFESVVETQSYVVFIKMSGLAAFLLFGYLESRKLNFAFAAGAAGGGRTLLHGFTSFVSSEGHAFSLSRTGMPALHVIVQGLQCLLHLAHTCWELMGPVKTAHAFLDSLEVQQDAPADYTDFWEPFLSIKPKPLLSFVSLSQCCAVSRGWRKSLLEHLRTLPILSFGKGGVTDADVLRSLGRVASENLRELDLSGCREIRASGMENILRTCAETCSGLLEVNITGCSKEAILRAVAIRAQAVCNAVSALELYLTLRSSSASRDQPPAIEPHLVSAFDANKQTATPLPSSAPSFCQTDPEQAEIAPAHGKERCPMSNLRSLLNSTRPLLLLDDDVQFAPEENALFRAAARGSDVDVALLLTVSFSVGGAVRVYEVEEKDSEGNAVLLTACGAGNCELAKFLVDAGAKVNSANNRDDTPLLVACGAGKLELAEMLIAAGAEVNSANRQGDTPLLAAFGAGNLELAEMLVSKGANVKAVRGDGAGLLSLAIVSQQSEMLKFALTHGPERLPHQDSMSDCDFTEAFAESYFDPVRIEAWLRTGASPLGLACEVGALMTSCALESSTKYRLQDVRAFIFHNLDMLQDPSKWPVKHAVQQLASQEADAVFGENADCDKAAGESRFIALINKREKHLCRSIHRAQSQVSAFCYSPDGSKLACAGGSEVVVCDASTGFVQKTLSGHSSRVSSVSFSSVRVAPTAAVTISSVAGGTTARPAEAARAAQQGGCAAAADACGEGGNGCDDEEKGMRAEIEKLPVEKAEVQRHVERLQAQALGLGCQVPMYTPDQPIEMLNQRLSNLIAKEGIGVPGNDTSADDDYVSAASSDRAFALQMHEESSGRGGSCVRHFSKRGMKTSDETLESWKQDAKATLTEAFNCLTGTEAEVQRPAARLHEASAKGGVEDSDTLHTVLSAIVTDPEGFFKLGAAENLDDLSFPEFMQACTSIVPSFSQGAAQSIFTKLDTNKNDKVSLEELTQTTEVTRHFYKESKCESVILAALMPLIAGAEPLQALAELSEGSLRDAVVDKVIKALVKQANEVRETLARKKDFEARENENGLGKFGTATYGGVADYDKGLEAVGTPHPKVLEQMKKEATEGSDSKEIFEAWNSGSNKTFPAMEWDFVVEPFKPESIRKDKHPSEWELKHPYGGKRFPIRLQVFLHVLSVMQMASGIRFGDYKNAHKLPFENPEWLHVAEVSFVKVVLLRLVKSQLGGVALFNAFNKHASLRLTGKSGYKTAKIKACRIVEALRQALHEKDGSESTCTYEFLVDKLKAKDIATEEQLEAILDHYHEKLADKNMSEAEVIGLREYSGPLYIKMNGSLRLMGAHTKITVILPCALEKCTEDFKQKFKEVVAAVAHAEADKVSMDFVADRELQTSTRITVRVGVPPQQDEADQLCERLTESAIKTEFAIKIGPTAQEMSNISVVEAAAVVGFCKHLKGNRYVNNIFATASGMRKLSQVSCIPEGRRVFRGMGEVKLTDEFVTEKEGGGRGGVDFAFMSTTTKREVAVSYIKGKNPILFECELDDINRGCPLSFVSQFPGEEEILVPAMSYLELIGKPYVMETSKGSGAFVTVYPARIHCNQKSQTIEEIQARRKRDVLSTMFYIAPELSRDLPLVVQVLRAALPGEQQREVLDQLHNERLKDFESKRKDWEKADAQEFNTDSVYKERIDYAIEFKHKSIVELSKLVYTNKWDAMKKNKVCSAVCVATDNKADELNTDNFVHVMSMEGRYDLAEAALSAGFTGDATLVRRDGATTLALAILLPDRLACKSNMLAILAGKSKILNLMLTTKINDDYLRQLSLAFFETSNIRRWLTDGWSPRGLMGVIGALLSSGATLSDEVDQVRLSDVRAFLNRHSDLLQDISPLASLTLPDVVEQLAFQESDVFATQSRVPFERWVHWINKPRRQQCRLTVQAGAAVISLAYSTDGSRVARAEGNDVVVCDAVSGIDLHRLMGHSGTVNSVAFSADGPVIVSGSNDNTVRLWDVETGSCKCTLSGHSWHVSSVSFSPDGKQVASGSWDKSVKIWETSTGTCVSTLTVDSAVCSVAFCPDGSKIAAAYSKEIQIFDAKTKAKLGSPLGGHSGNATAVSYSWMFSNFFDAKTKAKVGSPLSGHSGYVWSVCFTPDGKQLASGSEDNTVKIWETSTGTCVSTLSGHSSQVSSVSFSPDGTKLASGSWDHSVRIWETSTGTCVSTLTGHSGAVTQVEFAHDGATLVSGGRDGTTCYWDVQSGEAKSVVEDSKFAFSKASSREQKVGKFLITAEGDILRIFRSEGGVTDQADKDTVPVAFFRAPAPIETVDTSGAHIAVGCQNGEVLQLRAAVLLTDV